MDPSLGRLVLEIIALGVPVTLGVAAVFSGSRAPFRSALFATRVCALLAVLIAVCFVGWPAPIAPSSIDDPILGALAGAVRLDAITVLVLGLVCTLAVVVVRYSRTYLDGDPGQRRYARAMLATLATVTLLVIAENLLVVALAWMGTSFALHQLLTHYRDRPGAVVAAHKKFLVSRFADVCVLGGIGLLGTVTGGVDLEAVHAWAASSEVVPPSIEIAAVLLVIGVSLKTAQLPFHGWLTQVMEAPTPVSALLHAGVVNIGGLVLIRLAPVMMHSQIAMALLVVIGTATAVISALVMTARPTIKTSLAWSTSAQMGFMLVECGLGAWHLALLHLIVHSLYKAHAFLDSGGTVDRWRVHRLIQPLSVTGGHLTMATGLVALLLLALQTSVGSLELRLGMGPDPTFVPMSLLLGLSLVPLVARALASGPMALATIGVATIGAAGAFLAWHATFAQVVPPPPTVGPIAWGFVLAALGLQLGLQTALHTRPSGAVARALRPHLVAGLYFDAVFTRVVFRVWPPRLPQPTTTATPAAPAPLLEPQPQEQRA